METIVSKLLKYTKRKEIDTISSMGANCYKMILGAEMSITYTIALFGRTTKKSNRQNFEDRKTKEIEKNNSQENSFETT